VNGASEVGRILSLRPIMLRDDCCKQAFTEAFAPGVVQLRKLT